MGAVTPEESGAGFTFGEFSRNAVSLGPHTLIVQGGVIRLAYAARMPKRGARLPTDQSSHFSINARTGEFAPSCVKHDDDCERRRGRDRRGTPAWHA